MDAPPGRRPPWLAPPTLGRGLAANGGPRQIGGMQARPEFILYVEDQGRSRTFYAVVLDQNPVLDVPGMTEFDLSGALLGLMPQADMAELLGVDPSGAGQRCELYLCRPDAAEVLARAAAAGGRAVSALAPRPWGEAVGYALDPDGHVLAVALVSPEPA